MSEIWNPIKNYENYEVSNFGNVRNTIFKNNKIQKEKTHILKLNVSKRNRCTVHLYKNGKRKAFMVHRLVMETFEPNRNNFKYRDFENPLKIELDKLEINHKDGNPKNNNINNLEWSTKKYNDYHAYINGLTNLKKYNESKCKHIIRNDGKKYNNSYDASKDLNVSVCSIRDVLKGRTKTCKGYKFIYDYQREWSNKYE